MTTRTLAVYCHRSGVIGFARRAPKGVLVCGRGPDDHVRRAADAIARRGYDGKTLLVPGIPEAETEGAAFDAAVRFQKQIALRLARYATETAHV